MLQLLALVVLFVYGAATIDGFSSEITVDSMLVLAALLGLAALGQTLVLILGGIDFSVPGHIVMGAIVVSQLYGAHHWSAPLAIALVAVVAGVAGRGHRLDLSPLAHPAADRDARHRRDQRGCARSPGRRGS